VCQVMFIIKVVSPVLVKTCRQYLATDSFANVLVLGDLYEPFFGLSDIHAAFEGDRVVGVCSIYHAYTTPSIVWGTNDPDAKQLLIKNALAKIDSDFITLCEPSEVSLLKQYSDVLQHRSEQQMVANRPTNVETATEASRVHRNESKLLNDFYVEHHAEAWVPVQFRAGPYYCVKTGGKIVSAAGVHIVTPQIAQLGNIITDEAYRGRGYATACTSALAADLARRCRIISLFVRKDNAPAIHMYEKLGFARRRDIAFMFMRKKEREV